MTTSIIVVSRNENYLWFCINALYKSANFMGYEIIIVDDGSFTPVTINPSLYPNIKILRHDIAMGVGYSFDRGVELAQGETIILMAGDVIVKTPTWFDRANDFVNLYPMAIGCGTCLSLDPDHLNPCKPADKVKRYGATIIPFATTEDIHLDHLLAHNEDFTVEILVNHWIKTKPSDEISEIPSVYGAFYVTSKSWYNHIGGWNTNIYKKNSGHRAWGGLEALISIKSWLMGGRCYSMRDLEVGHIFHKFDKSNPERENTNGRLDFYWMNKFFMCYTLMDEETAKRLIEKVLYYRKEYNLHIRPFGEGQRLIKEQWDYVMGIRDKNLQKFKYDFNWYCDKFGIKKP